MLPVSSLPYQKISVNNVTPNLLRYKHFFIGFFILLLSFVLIMNIFSSEPDYNSKQRQRVSLSNVLNPPISVINNISHTNSTISRNCNYWNCFNVYRCGRSHYGDHILVYVYPLKQYVNQLNVPYTNIITKEFYEIIDAIIHSKYYTPDVYEACIFIPTIDTLNLNNISPKNLSVVLQNLEFWGNDGLNHLLFSMMGLNSDIGKRFDDLPIGKAMFASAGFDTWTFRRNFDISLPVYSPLQRIIKPQETNNIRSWLVISSDTVIHPDHMQELRIIEASHPELLILEGCEPPTNRTERCKNGGLMPLRFDYPLILQKATFCLIIRGITYGSQTFLEALASSCIPVIIHDSIVLPFSPHIDWKRAAIFILERNINTLMDVLKSVSDKHIGEMQEQIAWLYDMYFKDIKTITLTSLDILQDRINPHWAKKYEDWNVIPSQRSSNPLFLPIMGSKTLGFTAVVLTYDRVQSLFTLVEKLSRVPSLVKILVIWNNQKKAPPHSSQWPKVSKPVKVIQTSANKLSNRFYPYAEIETEAILNIDDDIIMLTSDELEFGYEVWREFPDRIVGFPSRTHRWDNVTLSWKYESEWTNDISMVLTGAAFLHKYWSYAYTHILPESIRDWVDSQMNCEDIAMNFLVANITNQSPIKVTPRKKFKCPECTNTEMLSADLGHMVERSACVDRFAREFGKMPLQAVEFRADPVLFKDPFPEKLKRFNDIGSL